MQIQDGSIEVRSDTQPLPPMTLVLGGARSGKSAFAETLVARAQRPVYVATAEAGDQEMAERIRRHKRRRAEHWMTVEEPLRLVEVLREHTSPRSAVLVDCLTLWIANHMAAGNDVDAEAVALVESFAGLAGPVVFVSNEVGLGIVPDNVDARAFRDHAGRLHQAIAAGAEHVYWVLAGIPTRIKPAG